MSRKSYWGEQLKPLGEAGIERMRVIAAEGANRVNGVLVDSESAHAVVAVYDKLGDAQRAQFKGLAPVQACELALSLIEEGSK